MEALLWPLSSQFLIDLCYISFPVSLADSELNGQWIIYRLPKLFEEIFFKTRCFLKATPLFFFMTFKLLGHSLSSDG